MADNDIRCTISETAPLMIHIEPIFEVWGAFNFTKKRYDINIKTRGGPHNDDDEDTYYHFHMYIRLFKGDYARVGMNPSKKIEILHVPPADWLGWNSFNTLRDGKRFYADFSSQDPDAYKSSDKYYLVMYCQQNVYSDIGGDEFAHQPCTITRTEPSYWNGYLKSISSGGKNPGGSAVYSVWDAASYSLLADDYDNNLEDDMRENKFTTVSFPLNPESKNYAHGTIEITSVNRNAAYTSVTVRVTYTKDSENPSPTFWGVESSDNKEDKYKSKIKIGIQDTLNVHVYKNIQYVSASINGNIVTAQYTFTGLTPSQGYNCYAFVTEDLGNGVFSKLSDGPILTEGLTEYAHGSVGVSATRDSTNGKSITVKGAYQKGAEDGKESASAYWGCKEESETSSANKSKVLVAICNPGGSIINSSLVANKGSYTFTGLSATTAYEARAYVVENLGGTKYSIGPATQNVPAWGTAGSITITRCERSADGTTLIVAASYSGSEPFYGNSTTNQSVTTDRKSKLFYYLRLHGETSGYLQRQRVENGSALAFGNLEKGTDYDFYAFATYAPANTKESQVLVSNHTASIGDHTGTLPVGVSGDITGTTITIAPEFNDDGESDNIEWTAKLGKVVESGVARKNNGKFETEPAKFQLLANATTYTIIFSGLYSGAVVQPDAGGSDEPNEEWDIPTAATALDLLNRDLYYDCMTYGVTVLQNEVSKNGFVGTAYQIVGAHGQSNHSLIECDPKGYAAFCRRRDGSSISSNNIGSVTFNNTTVESARIVGSSAGSVNFTGQTVNVTGLQPSTGYRLYVYLLDCYDFAGKYDAVGYIDFTTEPVAIAGIFQARVTGTSITVTPNIIRWNNSSSIEWSMTLTDENGLSADVGVSAIVTPSSSESIYVVNLDMGTKYFIDFHAVDDGDNEIEITPIEVVTYGIDITIGESHTRYVTDCVITYTEGERLASTPQDSTRGSAVKWFITEGLDDSTIVINPTYANCRRSNPYYFETTPRVLVPGRRYYIHAYIEGVLLDGTPDAYAVDWFILKEPAIELDGSTRASGTTITFTPTWQDSDSTGNTLTIVAGLYQYGVFITEKQSTYKDVGIVFTGLERGTEYTVAFAAFDNEGNTTADYIQYASGQNGLIDELTYKLSFNNYILSTRGIKASVMSNRALPVDTGLEYYIAQDGIILSNWDVGMLAPYDQIMFYYLVHNKNVTIGARFNSSRLVDENNKFDTDEYLYLKTPELTVEMDGYYASPHALKTIWKAYSNGNLIYIDSVSTYPIWFVSEKIEIVPVVRGDVGDNYGLFSYSNKGITLNEGARYFDGLSSGRQYKITMHITDGYNEASVIGYATTLVCTLRIYSTRDHKWHKALPYIVHNSYWYPAPAYVYHNKSTRTNPNQVIFSNDSWDGGRFMETNPSRYATPDNDLLTHPTLGDIRNYEDYYPENPENPVGDYVPPTIEEDDEEG